MKPKLPQNNTIKAQKFQKSVFSWFEKHGRKDLPWQKNKTPYRVYVSEIMLQQTQVSTVIPYFERFLKRFPKVSALAEASEDEVLHLWTGLGYYNRARNLHKTAKILMQDYDGKFPDTLEGLQSLPGIGRSTAGAILSIAFEKKAAILDGNVKRVLTRLHAIKEWPGEKNTEAKLWQLADYYTPTKRVADYTQAMMDIGATLCVRGAPHCLRCPFESHCGAHHEGIAKTLPKKKPSVKIPTRKVTLLILMKDKHHVLLEKRPTKGVWGGLWSLPESVACLTEKKLLQHIQERFRYSAKQIQFGEPFRHTFSHFHLDILPAFITLNSRTAKIIEPTQQIWYNLQQPDTVGLPAPVKTLLMGLKP